MCYIDGVGLCSTKECGCGDGLGVEWAQIAAGYRKGFETLVMMLLDCLPVKTDGITARLASQCTVVV